MRKIVVASIKGGVGKTAVSSGLTRSLKRLSFSVGYLDADITGGICGLPTWTLGRGRLHREEEQQARSSI